MENICDGCGKNKKNLITCESCQKKYCSKCSFPDCDWCEHMKTSCNSCLSCNKLIKLCSGNIVCMISVIVGIDEKEIAYCKTHKFLTYYDDNCSNDDHDIISQKDIVREKCRKLFPEYKDYF